MENFTYAVKLVPPRPDFAMTMTDEEKTVMHDHMLYWKKHMEEGLVRVFGPVLDTRGAYGFGIVTVSDEQQLKKFIEGDPSLRFNTAEYYPMLATFG